MRKDWSRVVTSCEQNVADVSLTTQLFGESYLNSAFAEMSLKEESVFTVENFRIKIESYKVDEHENYIEGGIFEQKTIQRLCSEVVDEEYDFEFKQWLGRGFKLWAIYPNAIESSPILKVWHEEIISLREEFIKRQELKSKLPF